MCVSVWVGGWVGGWVLVGVGGCACVGVEHSLFLAHARTHAHGLQVIDASEGGQVIFTYDVEWEMSSVKWASRWDVYLQVIYIYISYM